MRTLFLEKSFLKYGGKMLPKHVSKKSNLSISRDQQFKVSYSLCCMPSGGLCQVILKRNWGPLAFTSYKAFLKNKKRSGTSLPTLFSAWFLKKNIYLVIFH